MPGQLWKRAETDLALRLSGAAPDLLVWEHSERVARICDAIRLLPELKLQTADRLALTAAALYHDAGWVLQARSGEAHSRELLLRPTSDVQRELAADWMSSRVKDLLGAGVLNLAARTIRQCNDRRTDLVEAQILAEAENLDEIGPTTICLIIRKKLAEGKTLADVVAAWQRQEEYHYWQARLKESFRFASVRTIAEKRLEALRRFMSDLRSAVRLEDITTSSGSDSPVLVEPVG